MKRFLLLTLLCLISTIAIAQTTWTGGGADTNWNTTDNWDTNLVPTAADDVIIPTGFTATLNVAGTIKSINVQGNSVFEMNANLTFTNPSTLGVNTTINWAAGTLNGTASTVTNQGTINITTTVNSFITGSTTLDNQGTINFTGSGDLFINLGSVLNNPIGSVIDIQADDGNINTSTNPAGVLNNAGLIKKTTSTGEAVIFLPINNNDGIIQVEVGTLSFLSNNGINFTDGTYNVFAGATMDWDTVINPSGTLSGTIVGDLNWNSIVNVVDGTYAAINFSETDNFNWKGTLTGGGTLTNTNVLNFAGTYNSFITSSTTLDNQGTINVTGSGDLSINLGSVLNNPIGSVIDMQADSGNINTSTNPAGVLNNAGLIKKTTSSGEAQISIPINNNDGTIQVEVGTLSFQSNNGKNFTDGTYNVFAGATMDWDTTINPSGTLEGTVVGDLNWNSIVNVVDGTYAAINFSETDNFNWKGTLSGGGTLTNTNVLNFAGTNNSFISGGTTLDNQGTINFTGGGDLFINNLDSVLNNSAGGVIDMQVDGGNINFSSNPAGVFNNAGLIKRSTTTGLAQIRLELNNYGTIEVVSGELEHTGSRPFTNTATGIIKGIGIFDLPTVANYTNNGTFAPGLSPGTLSVQGDYISTTSSVLDVELDGLTPDTEYDVLAITGTNVVFEGSVNVSIGFDADENDTFDIATTTGTIITKNLVSPIIVEQDGKRYTFGVTYPNDNIVRLTITEKLDIQVPDVITQNITVQLDASGNASITTAQIDNGSTDNCTLVPDLVYGLDIVSFTCDNLGANTVMLTVTDEENNSATLPATVTVEDNISPTALVQNVTVQLDATGNAFLLFSAINNGSSDNCSFLSFNFDRNFTCADIGENSVEFTATDFSGNAGTATAIVTVEDGINPVITCPANFSVDSAGSLTLPNYYDLNNVTAADNCAVDTVVQSPVAGTILEDGDHVISYTVTDTSGNTHNCSFTLNVNDTTLSIDDYAITEANILIYPNPASDKITLKNSSNVKLIEANILDVNGRIIESINLNDMATHKDIDIQGLSNGVYFIRVISINNVTVKQLIKK